MTGMWVGTLTLILTYLHIFLVNIPNLTPWVSPHSSPADPLAKHLLTP